jgi:HAD superfamily hydrolase (TIGR01509 family)
MIRGAIFDMDGTLLDTMPFWNDAGKIYLKGLNVQAEPSLGKKLFSMTMGQAAEYLKHTYSLPFTPEKIIEGINGTVREFYQKRAALKANIPEFLKQLTERNIRLVLATVTERKLAEAALSRCGILNDFDFVMTDAEVGAGKDRPDIYLKAAEKIGTAPMETLVFEDALYAAKTAKAAGFCTVGVYDEASRDDQQRLESICDYYIRNFRDFDSFETKFLK